MAYNWHIEFWFSVRIMNLYNGTTYKRRIVITPAPILPFYLQHHRTVDVCGGYVAYWSQFYQLFTNSSPVDGERQATEIGRLEGDILEALNDALHVSPIEVATFPISEIEVYTPSIASARWMQSLQDVTKLDPSLKNQDKVVVRNVKFLIIVGEIFGNYTNQQILQFLAWQFVEHYGPVADIRLLLARYGDQTTADNLRPADCGFYVEVAYKLMLLAMQFTLRISEDDQKQINRGFDRMRRNAIRLAKAAVWLDSESKDSVVAKLEALKLAVWPPSTFLSNESLEEIYQRYPEREKTFGNYWIKSIRSLRTTEMDSLYKYVLTIPPNYAQPYFVYDYLFNTVRVAIAAIDHPLYYSEGTSAMFYGGLGFSLALEIVKAIDREGLHWRPGGAVVPSIISQQSKNVFEVRENCLKHSEEGKYGLFPEIPALQVAYSAFLDTTKEGERDPPISYNFTQTQVFFLTLCYMTCSQKGVINPFSANCNKVARNSVGFANAFGCPPGSKMNPVQKCTFFG
ncbi:membrane metallo-endopeptidase-like 1 [Dermacentor silvarum]|uniref:membrane metallo-endopeptidase-like 1 n=1 Tax=Dermacentor silvarum TaxID=543639 RepID=UPI0018994C54|nr:membrane metallo-endopeptidase-like 1 [Dermacentor silvarum]